MTGEPSCKDEARIGQKNSLTRVWGQTGSRPAAPKLGFASAYVFGAVCPVEGKAAALIMPVCNTLAMNHHLSEISSQVTTPRFREGRLCPCRGDPRSCWLAPQPRARGPRQHHLVGAAAPGLRRGRLYSPQLNPVERVWHYLRSHLAANSVFPSLADLMDACEMAWNRFATDHGLIRSLCAVAWAPASPAL